MNVSFICSVDNQYGLGKDNDLLFYIKEDLQWFKEKTLHKNIIMGYNTFQSLPKILPQRNHIVLTRQRQLISRPNVTFINSIDELIDRYIDEELFVIGGGKTFDSFLPFVNKIYITRVDVDKEADSFFPSIDWDEWRRTYYKESSDEGYNYSFNIYEK